LTLEDVDTPVPRGDEVLVRVEAAAVNDFDLGLLRGSPLLVRFFNGLVKPRVRILGCDVAGSVASGSKPGS
jgi:NADPH:quinone reductase-like Zn-dependent oxidoreductase